MTELKLKTNQAALILTVSDDGEVDVNVAAPKTKNVENMAVDICTVIGQKLAGDEQFQAMILTELDGDSEKIEEKIIDP